MWTYGSGALFYQLIGFSYSCDNPAMRSASPKYSFALAACLISIVAYGQPPGRGPQSELLRQGQQLVRQGKLDEALDLYKQELQKSPDSAQANNAAGGVQIGRASCR